MEGRVKGDMIRQRTNVSLLFIALLVIAGQTSTVKADVEGNSPDAAYLELSAFTGTLHLQHHGLLRSVTQYVSRSGLITKQGLFDELQEYTATIGILESHLPFLRKAKTGLPLEDTVVLKVDSNSAHTIHKQLIQAMETLLHNGEPTLVYTENLVDWIDQGDFQGLSEILVTLYTLRDDINDLDQAANDYADYIDGVQSAMALSLKRRLQASYSLVAVAVLIMLGFILLYIRNKTNSANGLKKANEELQREVQSSMQLSARLEHHATHDSLSGVLNRRGFCNELDKLLEDDDSQHGLCFIDLDFFKIVNDTSGHVAGDELIRQFSLELQTVVESSGSLAARFGGDEFLILMPNCTNVEFRDCIAHASRVLSPFKFIFDDRSFAVTGSFGAVHFSAKGYCQHSLLSVVDSACYVAKHAGGDRVHYFNDDNSVVERRKDMEWVTKINQALETGSFCLLYQPIVKTATEESAGDGSNKHLVHSWELLVRMIDADGSLISPGFFLEIAERYSLATSIDRWVVQTSLEWLEANKQVLDEIEMINVNLSGKTIGDLQFLEYIEQLVPSLSVPSSTICFEITETAVIGERSLEFLQRLKELGFKLAIDDFGSGYSSFGYLEKLPVDYIKVDGSFVQDIDTSTTHKEFVRAINTVGKAMNKLIVAEFLENAESLEVLQELDVDFVQGYYIAKPARLPDCRIVESEEIAAA